MVIDLDSFERNLAIDEKIPAGEIDLGTPNVRLASDVLVRARIEKSAATTSLRGGLTGTLEIDCDRCLEPRERPIDIKLDLEFVPVGDLGGEANLELHHNDLKLDALVENAIDLTEIAREQILLEMPQQFFCREDCEGLCQKCGANLNLKACDCKETEIDPRWAALKNLI